MFNTNHYQSIAGYVEVGIRLVFMLWFIVELKETSKNLEAAAIRNTKTESKFIITLILFKLIKFRFYIY